MSGRRTLPLRFPEAVVGSYEPTAAGSLISQTRGGASGVYEASNESSAFFLRFDYPALKIRREHELKHLQVDVEHHIWYSFL